MTERRLVGWVFMLEEDRNIWEGSVEEDIKACSYFKGPDVITSSFNGFRKDSGFNYTDIREKEFQFMKSYGVDYDILGICSCDNIEGCSVSEAKELIGGGAASYLMPAWGFVSSDDPRDCFLIGLDADTVEFDVDKWTLVQAKKVATGNIIERHEDRVVDEDGDIYYLVGGRRPNVRNFFFVQKWLKKQLETVA